MTNKVFTAWQVAVLRAFILLIMLQLLSLSFFKY